MTTAQAVETKVTVNNNSPTQDYVHPPDQTQPTFESWYIAWPFLEMSGPQKWVVGVTLALKQNFLAGTLKFNICPAYQDKKMFVTRLFGKRI